MEIYESARKHGITEEQIRHAIDHALVVADEEGEARVLYLGPDQAGNLLEVVSVSREDGTEIVIHAMGMSRRYERLLPDQGDANG